MLSGVLNPARCQTGVGPAGGGGGVTEAEALADVIALGGGGGGGEEALVVGAVDVGVSPPHATTRSKTRDLRMGRA
jgi:hypothetical protein